MTGGKQLDIPIKFHRFSNLNSDVAFVEFPTKSPPVIDGGLIIPFPTHGGSSR